MSSINEYDYYGYDNYDDYDDRHLDTGSHFVAEPNLQLGNRREARQITKAVRDVYKNEKKSGDWKGKAVNALILIAVASALIALGVLLHTGFALGIGIGLAAYGLYQTGKTIEKGLAQKEIERVHEDATVQRLSERVQRNQNGRQSNRRRGNTEVQQGAPSAYAPSAPPRQSAYIPPVNPNSQSNRVYLT